MRKLSKEKKVYLGLLILSIVIYLFTRVVYSGTLLFFILLYGILCKIGVAVAGKNVKVSVHVEGEGQKNQPVHCRMEIENLKLLPIFNLRITLGMSNKLSGLTDVKRMATSLLPRGKKTVEFAFQDNCCGEIDIEVVDFVVSDPLNIWQRPIEKGEAIDICRIPPVISDAAVSEDDLDQFDMESFRFSDVLKGNDPSETVGIKTYESGDSIKAIHWKLSSKLDDVVIREFGYPIDNKVLVLLDKKLPEELGTTGGREAEERVCWKKTESIDRTVNLFMSISSALLRREINHTLGWYDYEQQVFVSNSVTCDDDMYGSIPLLIGSPFSTDEQATAVHFLESDGVKNYGSILFVTDRVDIEDELERLRDYGEVRVFRPGSEED